jgi:chemotaxis protein CheD
MLPHIPTGAAAKLSGAAARRYVDFAIRELAERLDALGASRREAEVKLFGGADVLTASVSTGRPTVGKLNAEMALRVLSEEGFAVAASHLGGNRGIHLQFDTGTGEVLLRRLG